MSAVHMRCDAQANDDMAAAESLMHLGICTYNCNGLARLRQFADDNTLDGVMRDLNADIVCFQETKMNRADVWPQAFERIARLTGWDSYFCFTRKGGYSGVATYCRTAVTAVRAAEEGLLRVLPPQNPVHATAVCLSTAAADSAAAGAATAAHPVTPLSATVTPSAVAEASSDTSKCTTAQQTSTSCVGGANWPPDIVFPGQELRSMFTAEEAVAVDKDGRCLITDHGLFVLFNCYFPACTGNNTLQQIEVKRNMWRALDVRMRALLASGRHVILAGDFNVVLTWRDQQQQQPGRSMGTFSTKSSSSVLPSTSCTPLTSTPPTTAAAEGAEGTAAAVARGAEDTAAGPQTQRADRHPAAKESVTPQQLQQQSKETTQCHASLGHTATSHDHPQQQQQQQQLQGSVSRSRAQAAASQGDQQAGCGDVCLQQMIREDPFSPHATFRRGKPVLPSSGTVEWLMRLTGPAGLGNHPAQLIGSHPNRHTAQDANLPYHDSGAKRQLLHRPEHHLCPHSDNYSSAAGSMRSATAHAAACSGQGPEAGVLIDTLKHLNPGVQLFKYPDARRPGHFKERPPFTHWDQYYGIRNDQHGARGDYIFVADAADYLAQLTAAPQQQQQRPVQPQVQSLQQAAASRWQQQALKTSLSAALSAACILRELRWTDHAPVVLHLQLPITAAQLLRPPAANSPSQNALRLIPRDTLCLWNPTPHGTMTGPARTDQHAPAQLESCLMTSLTCSTCEPFGTGTGNVQHTSTAYSVQHLPSVKHTSAACSRQPHPSVQHTSKSYSAQRLFSPDGQGIAGADKAPMETQPVNCNPGAGCDSHSHSQLEDDPSMQHPYQDATALAQLPCSLSTYWLTHSQMATAAATSLFAAAGQPQPPASVMSCCILQQLQHSQYQEATQDIMKRAQQLYRPGDHAEIHAGTAAGAASKMHSKQLDDHVAVDTTAAAAAGAQALYIRKESPAADFALHPAGLSTCTGSPTESRRVLNETESSFNRAAQGTSAAPAAHVADTNSLMHHSEQRQQAWTKRAQQDRRSEKRSAGDSHLSAIKRRGRGWAVVRMGNGCTATVACSSSDDSMS